MGTLNCWWTEIYVEKQSRNKIVRSKSSQMCILLNAHRRRVLDWGLWALDEQKHKHFICRPPLVFVFSNSAKSYFAQCSRKNGPWLRPCWPNVNPLLSKCRNDLLINAFSHCHASSTMNLSIFKSSHNLHFTEKTSFALFACLKNWRGSSTRLAGFWQAWSSLAPGCQDLEGFLLIKLPCLLRVSFNGLRGTQLVESESRNSDEDQKWTRIGRKWKWEFWFRSRN